MKTLCHMLVIASAMALSAARPQILVATTTTPTPRPATESSDERIAAPPERPPIITQFRVRSDVQFRYAKTVAESYVKNPNVVAGEVTFELVLPDTAFVSNFSMLIDGMEYVAKVDEKEEAQETYNREVTAGNNAGIVNQDTRDANLIRVSVNVAAQGKVRFRLTYEELLERRLGRYDQVIHVNPGQIVDDFQIDVFIEESLPLSFVTVPELKTDPNAITSSNQNPDAIIEMDKVDKTKAHVTYKPSTTLQKLVNEDSGVNGQFIVQYDVDRKNQNGEVQVLDGYFVHYFAPDSLETLPKHVVFVLDVSGSMYGTKLQQTKDAMVTVIDDMTDQDYFNIITFSDEVYHWKPENEKLLEEPHVMTYQGNDEIKSEALSHVLSLETVGGTNINDGMLEALRLVTAVRRSETIPANTKSMIIFLTDGQATTGVTGDEAIRTNIADENSVTAVPIYGLAFGSGADFSLMKRLSQENGAFARKIYEASDAAIQLEDFYLQIAGPKLQNVKIEYVGEAVQNGTFTKSGLDTFNEGNELVIAGKIDENRIEGVEVIISGEGKNGTVMRHLTICPLPKPLPLPIEVEATEGEGQVVPDEVTPLRPNYPTLPGCIPFPQPKPREPTSEAQNFIERLWAFKTINELLKKSDEEEKNAEAEIEDEESNEAEIKDEETNEAEEEEDESISVEEVDREIPIVPPNKSSKQKAVDLSLKYNFVTPLTSLVVTRPKPTNDTGEEGEEDDDDDETLVIDPVPVQSGFRFGCPSCNFGHRAASASFGGLLRPSSAGGGLRGAARPQYAIASVAYQPKVAVRGPPGPPPTRLSSASTTTASLQADVDYSYSDYGTAGILPESISQPTTTSPATCDGSISLHDKTYLRGLNVTVTEDVDDLTTSPSGISKKLTSLEVTGDCCWTVYKEADFDGAFKVFSPGASRSAANMGAVFRAAGSVRKSVC